MFGWDFVVGMLGAFLVFLVFIVLVYLATRVVNSLAARWDGTGGRRAAVARRDSGNALPSGTESSSENRPEEGQSIPPHLHRLYTLTGRLAEIADVMARVEDFLVLPQFQALVAALRDDPFTVDDRRAYAVGDHALVAAAALEALRDDPWDDGFRTPLLEQLPHGGGIWTVFALRLLQHHYPEGQPIVGEVLLAAGEQWLHPFILRPLRRFVAARLQDGEELQIPVAHWVRIPPPRRRMIAYLAGELGPQVARVVPSSADLERHDEESEREEPEGTGESGAGERPGGEAGAGPNIDLLRRIGIVRTPEPGSGRTAPDVHSELLPVVTRMHQRLTGERMRPVLVVGERGVGKTSALEILSDTLLQEGWTVFQAGHTEILAGTMYVGTLEERLSKIIDQVRTGRRVLWIIPDFHLVSRTGRHQQNPMSVLDQMLPRLERGEFIVAGETEPGPYDQLLREYPALPSIFEILRLEPMDRDRALLAATEWAGKILSETPGLEIDEEILQEAWNLAEQFLKGSHPPGNLIDLLKLAVDRRREASSGDGRVTRDDLMAALSGLTGLPSVILDDRVSLDLDGLRRHFQERIQGQQEAIDCLVARVAMVKSGLCDPRRPLGVFLFAGPTGTGKTALAKALSEYLFGAPDRMIRLDMSEMVSADAVGRILGVPVSMGEHRSLVQQIRSRPFSIVLLDEVEKTHPQIWNLFLQLFDDGRLTDEAGQTADFRHAIIIMTSNLGGVIAGGTPLGFNPETGVFHPQAVRREIDRAFRKEFLNRIDRIVVFHPLDRDTMRSILFSELEAAARRRGFRQRHWVLEWDEAAIDFLLEKGFTPDLGARPLRRVIERHLLAPLATAIVRGKIPDKNPFLLVKVDGNRLEVEPLSDEEPPRPECLIAQPRMAGPASLEIVAFDPEGSEEEVAYLADRQQHLADLPETVEWQARKSTAIGRISQPGFWESADRFVVLGEIEYMERVREGLNRAGIFLNRIEGLRERTRIVYPRRTVAQIAHRLLLLDVACRDVQEGRPHQAFLSVEACVVFGRERDAADAFAARVGGMYLEWARQRGMRVDRLEERLPDGHERYRLVLAVSGFGAYSILALEDGTHVFEEPAALGSDRDFRRYRVRVRVAPMPDGPHVSGRDPGRTTRLLEQARSALASSPQREADVVRRYREEPSPLVRDAVRGWRTGRAERVFGGDFDVVPIEGGPGGP